MSSSYKTRPLTWLRTVRSVFLSTIACAMSVVVVNAEESSSDTVQIQIEQLVQQLGDESFQKRERAGRELLQLKLQTKTSLLAGMNSEDAEIALRCRRLWGDVRIEAGWQQVRKVTGDSLESRELFGLMFLADPGLWYKLAEEPRSCEAIFQERLTQLQEQFTSKQFGNWEGALANLLYFGLQKKWASPQHEFPRLDDLLSSGRSQQAFKDSESLRKLREEWMAATSTDGPAIDRLLIALRDYRSQAVEIARELLRDEGAPAKQRQYALLALATSDSPDDERLISDSLTDSTSLDVLFVKGVVIKSQLRDVALAVQIYRNGGNPKNFGFDYLRPDDNTLYSPSSLGFKDATERDAAFKKWSTFVVQQGDQGSPRANRSIPM